MTPIGIVTALAFAVSAPGGMAAPSARLASFVVVRTKDDVHGGRRLRFEGGRFLVEDGDRRTAVPEGDVAQVVFVPGLNGPPLSTAVGLAFRVALPDRARRLPARRVDLLEALLRSGGIFFLRDDELPTTFRRFVTTVAEPELTGVLCYELVRLCQRGRKEQTAVRVLGEAEKELRGSDRGFVCALMQAALLRATGDPRIKDVLRDLSKRYEKHHPELKRFREFALGEFPRRFPRGPARPGASRAPDRPRGGLDDRPGRPSRPTPP